MRCGCDKFGLFDMLLYINKLFIILDIVEMKFVLRVINDFRVKLKLYSKNYNWWVSCLLEVFSLLGDFILEDRRLYDIWVKINISGKKYEIFYLILVKFLNIFFGNFVKR